MLKIQNHSRLRTCNGLSRRSMLGLGLLGVGAWAADPRLSFGQQPSYARDKSVILIFLAGGPSQHETWDPKPHGPGTSTSISGHIPTAIPGVRFGSDFPLMASMADRLTIVRSFQTHHAEHNGAHKQILTADTSIPDGKPIKQPGMGAVVSAAVGSSDPVTGLPRHAIIPPTTRHTREKAGFAGAYDSVVEGSQPAWMSPAHAPFELKVPMAEGQPSQKKSKRKGNESPAASDELIANLTPTLDGDRMRHRRELLGQLDRLEWQRDSLDRLAGSSAQYQRAWDVLSSTRVRDALDFTQEDPRVLADYDTEHFRNYRCRDNSTFDRSGPSIGVSLGRQLLMARRLCEAGCRFVTIIHANWDFHARKGIPNVPEGMSVLAPPLDHAVAAFLKDTEARGLDDKILLTITGEFGRTPKLDENLGRHHWPRLCPLVFAGGGLRHGQVIGQSDRRGGEPDGQPHTIDNLHATIMHTMFDVAQMRLDSGLPKIAMERATRGNRIEEMF